MAECKEGVDVNWASAFRQGLAGLHFLEETYSEIRVALREGSVTVH
jgi:hypothetical protein